MKKLLFLVLAAHVKFVYSTQTRTWGDLDDWDSQRVSISTDSIYYIYSYDIIVSFRNPSGLSLDWIGIFDSTADYVLDELLLWLYICGSQTCSGTGGSQSGELTFGYGDPIEDSDANAFPLPPGDYVAVLARNEAQPFEVLATSDFFVLPPDQGSPPSPPSPSPPTPEPPTPTRSTSVSTNRNNYRIGETIEVTFYNPRPQSQDWIAIYDSDVDLNNLSGSGLWLYTCGSQDCWERSRQGTLDFGYGPPDESWGRTSFPLQRGNYVAVLARSLGLDGSQTLAYSSAFRVG